jgi:hypothetical protein
MSWQVRWAATLRDLMKEYPVIKSSALVPFRQAFICGR